MANIANKFGARLGSCSFRGVLDCLASERMARQARQDLDAKIEDLRSELKTATDDRRIAGINKVLGSLEIIQRVQNSR